MVTAPEAPTAQALRASSTARRSIDAVLAQARERLTRLTPREAQDAAADGALLVDIRPDESREVEGSIPGALVVHRNVLEWRFDPTSEARVQQAAYDLQVIVFCNEGYTSSLAAASLLDLGLHSATDIIGGFRAWRAAGLPVTPATFDIASLQSPAPRKRRRRAPFPSGGTS